MTSIFKLLSLTLFLGLVSQAYGECSLKDISIKQYKTSSWAHGMPVWSVNITNNCICTQSQLKLNCKGFQTYLSVDPEILGDPSNDECLVNQGEPIYYAKPLNFAYAWDPKFPFQPIYSKIACS
uniref:Protein TAPETUM DETERMINANT 1-like isoform X2 n=1 Tax=Cicer arietinum TaxID=3827 RepID=A0A3Q7XP22_CICAR|nr:protein TAPETUM DETERMINANT 1-like isoform X2 [Cicer arietinum]